MTKQTTEKTVAAPLRVSFDDILNGSIVDAVTEVILSFPHPTTGQTIETVVFIKALPYQVTKNLYDRMAQAKDGKEGQDIILEFVAAAVCNEDGSAKANPEKFAKALPQNALIKLFNLLSPNSGEEGKA